MVHVHVHACAPCNDKYLALEHRRHMYQIVNYYMYLGSGSGKIKLKNINYKNDLFFLFSCTGSVQY